MFKPSKRCGYCAHKLVDDKCINKECIINQIEEKNTVEKVDDKQGDK
ncbi:MAG: hypothetical protein SOY76_03055 [Veillonella caviae]|nr:hypothetical protein [uncultured Veillonella sp.]MDY3973595.1 hypothetical protein [Veillonella caviae]